MHLAGITGKLHEPERGSMAIIQTVDAALDVQPVLVLDSEEAVAEIMQLKTMPLAGTDTAGFCLIPFLAFCLIPSTLAVAPALLYWSLAQS